MGVHGFLMCEGEVGAPEGRIRELGALAAYVQGGDTVTETDCDEGLKLQLTESRTALGRYLAEGIEKILTHHHVA